MKDRILEAFEARVAAGKNRMGEVLIWSEPDGQSKPKRQSEPNGYYELRHYLDHDREDLELFTKPEAARLIASLDEADEYRPLKSAPNLRRGWKLALQDLGEVRLALDFFYPAMLGTLLVWEEQRLTATNFRDTLNRQSGMYAVAKKIGNAQADELIGATCRHDTKCLKRIIWRIDQDRPITTLGSEKFLGKTGSTQGAGGPDQAEIAMICCEACNLLVAAARQVVKQSAQ